MRERRCRIGALSASYALGRRDARAGLKRKRGGLAKRLWNAYNLGQKDEAHAMMVDRRLIQTEMPFMHEDAHDADGPLEVSG